LNSLLASGILTPLSTEASGAGRVGRTKTTAAPKSLGRDVISTERWRFTAYDALIVVALTVSAFVLRRRGLPDAGLWHDDSAPALGAAKGSLSQLLTVSFDHPTFTVGLRAWWFLTGQDWARTPDLAFVAGTLSPAVLYLVLCRLGYARSISILLGAALVASDMDIIYSGRVKTYVLDALVVLGLAVVVPRLARRRWHWGTGLAWFAGALIVGLVSGFALVATAVAGIILLLHGSGDRRVRVIAVGAQLVGVLVFLSAMHRTYNAQVVAGYWNRNFDGFLDFDPNPVRFGADIFEHLTRIATVFPGGPTIWAALAVLAATVGLVAIAWSGPHAIQGRFLLLLAFVAFVAGVLDKIPFGPKVAAPGNGARVTLWLVPVMAIGLAAALQLVQKVLLGRSSYRMAFDVVAVVLAAGVVIAAIGRDTPPYPLQGSNPATRYVESRLGKHDAVFVLPGGRYSFALDSKFDVSLFAQPDRNVGFAPRSHDPRVNYFDARYVPQRVIEQIQRGVRGADRVFIHAAPGGGPAQWLYTLELLRASLGFRVERSVAFYDARVVVWRR
jgi:hypothetical protein